MTLQPQSGPRQEILSLVLRVGLFVLIVILSWMFLPLILYPIVDYYAAAALTVFGAGAIANAIVYRIYERASLMEAGLEWSAASRRNLALGIGIGVGFGALIILMLYLTGLAHFDPPGPVSWPSITFVTILLLFGAVGEELMFRGYAFQTLSAKAGKYATLLPMAVVFGMVHAGNVAATQLSVINTVIWGALLGYATLRSRGLWLPIGIHYGWNWILPMLGANLSGFKMGVTGLRLNSAETSWAGGAYGPEASLVLTLLLPSLFYLIHKMTIPAQQALLLKGLDED